MKYEKLNTHWFNWFLGFVEGNDCFTINDRGDLAFIITLREDNKFILEEIAETLEVGRVIVQTKHIVPGRLWTYRYIVTSAKELHRIITIINGNLVFTRRKNEFKLFVEAYNKMLARVKINRKKKFEDLSFIEYKESSRMPEAEDAWLSGFTDANGYFTIKLLSNPKVQFILTQKTNLNCNTYEVLDHIKNNIFGCGTIHKNKVIGLRVEGLKNIIKLFPYFNKFVLRTFKYNSYLRFKDIVERIKNKEHLDTEKREILKSIYKNS